MSKRIFKGRPLTGGNGSAKAVVSHRGFNTLASFQKSAMKSKCTQIIASDQNNPDIYGKLLTGMALCLPITIGSTTGGMILQTVASMGIAPSIMLFSKTADTLALSGLILARNWEDNFIIGVDNLGDEFLEYVQDGDMIYVKEDGVVTVERESLPATV